MSLSATRSRVVVAAGAPFLVGGAGPRPLRAPGWGGAAAGAVWACGFSSCAGVGFTGSVLGFPYRLPNLPRSLAGGGRERRWLLARRVADRGQPAISFGSDSSVCQSSWRTTTMAAWYSSQRFSSRSFSIQPRRASSRRRVQMHGKQVAHQLLPASVIRGTRRIHIREVDEALRPLHSVKINPACARVRLARQLSDQRVQQARFPDVAPPRNATPATGRGARLPMADSSQLAATVLFAAAAVGRFSTGAAPRGEPGSGSA